MVWLGHLQLMHHKGNSKTCLWWKDTSIMVCTLLYLLTIAGLESWCFLCGLYCNPVISQLIYTYCGSGCDTSWTECTAIRQFSHRTHCGAEAWQENLSWSVCNVQGDFQDRTNIWAGAWFSTGPSLSWSHTGTGCRGKARLGGRVRCRLGMWLTLSKD